MEEPQITVGILSGKEIEFSFPESFTTPDGTKVSGAQKAVYQKEKIYWSGKEYDELIFYPQPNAGIFFELKDVTIGINFHWERKEVQRFQGALKIIVEGETLTAINVISIEDYLTSVISSEMSATASLELLKAHAVISRSWLINKLRVENEKWKATIQPDSAANSPLSTLNLSNGMIMKRIRTLMFVRMIIASAIRELPVLLLHKLSKLFQLPVERC